MIYCKELDKSFETEKELFKELRDNHDSIIASKKAVIYNTKSEDNKGSISLHRIDPTKLQDNCKSLKIDEDYYYIAVNTTNILDSHEDLHVNGIWNKTAKEQQGNVYLLWDHELKGGSVIVKKKNIELLIAEIPFALLGQSYTGNTEALIYKFRKTDVIDDKAKEWLQANDEIQASVRMQYVRILFALNSDAQEDKEYKQNYTKYIDQVANKADFDNGIDYFWAVLEAKNIAESSLVLFGSNHATGNITESTKINEPSDDTQKEEPSNGTLTIEEFRAAVKKGFNN